MHDDFTAMPARAVLPQIDALPSPESEPTRVHGNRELRRREGGAHMRRHVVGPFSAVLEERVTVGSETREEPLEIGPNIGVRVLLDEQAGGGVPHEERQQALPDAGAV